MGNFDIWLRIISKLTDSIPGFGRGGVIRLLRWRVLFSGRVPSLGNLGNNFRSRAPRVVVVLGWVPRVVVVLGWAPWVVGRLLGGRIRLGLVRLGLWGVTVAVTIPRWLPGWLPLLVVGGWLMGRVLLVSRSLPGWLMGRVLLVSRSLPGWLMGRLVLMSRGLPGLLRGVCVVLLSPLGVTTPRWLVRRGIAPSGWRKLGSMGGVGSSLG